MRILFFLFIVYFNLFANKNILILNSYHKGFEFSDTIIKNIENIFYDNEDINTDILYMNSKQIDTKEYINRLNNLYSLQLKNISYDLIIVIDKFAYKFIVKNYSKLFKNEKILFIGIEQYSKELAKIYKIEDRLNGLMHKLAIKDNINLIMQLMPRLKKLYILNDRSYNANDTSELILKSIREIKNKVKVEYLRDDTLEDLKKYFDNYKKDEAILFVRFSNDSKGDYYRTNEVALAIKNFKLPVFSTDTLFLNKGVIGGKLISIDEVGLQAGKFAVDILNKDINSPLIKIFNSHKNIFDYKELNKYNLKIPNKIKDYKVINMPKTFFEKNSALINSVFLGTPLLFIIIIGLLDSLHNKRVLTRKLKERLEFEKVLLNAIDSPIFWQDKRGIILDMNKKFSQLVELSYEKLVGNSLDDFTSSSLKIKRITKVLKILSQTKTKSASLRLKDKAHKKIFYHINQAYFKVEQEDGIVTIFTNITKDRQIEQEREKQTQYLIQQSKLIEIGEVFSSIAHQWKSPLVAITALVQDMFYSNSTLGKEEDSYHIKNIMIQAKYMTDTINDFQDFIVPSKVKTVFNVSYTIDKMLNIVKHNLKYNYIKVSIIKKECENLNIYGYENEFMQAILNIVNNAKDALLVNKQNNRTLDIILKNRYNTLIIDIVDNANGIKKEDSKKIFEQYFSTKKDGHGIGLYMTKLIIQDKLSGKIFYKKDKNGSKFRIILKLYKGM